MQDETKKKKKTTRAQRRTALEARLDDAIESGDREAAKLLLDQIRTITAGTRPKDPDYSPTSPATIESLAQYETTHELFVALNKRVHASGITSATPPAVVREIQRFTANTRRSISIIGNEILRRSGEAEKFLPVCEISEGDEAVANDNDIDASRTAEEERAAEEYRVLS